MDMTINEFKFVTSTCWNETYQPPATDMTKGKIIGRYRFRLKSIFVPDRSLFQKYYTEFIFDDTFNVINEY